MDVRHVRQNVCNSSSPIPGKRFRCERFAQGGLVLLPAPAPTRSGASAVRTLRLTPPHPADPAPGNSPHKENDFEAEAGTASKHIIDY